MSRSLTSTAESRQQRLHRLRQLCEHVLDRSGAAVVHARLAVLMENPLFTPVAAASALGTARSAPRSAPPAPRGRRLLTAVQGECLDHGLP
ncbi:hypothetical protein ACFC8N_24820 [Streptomyces sp. NPDC055966]|uniref:hypothetical protein n=1 Tax=Streptomyces sp. NPDC055966 TaxID=3345669 RepID=UPI0035E298CB